MPKIVINEYDLTKAGTGEYANFSVLLPGFLGSGKKIEDLKKAGILDENNIYECSSQTDFVDNIGKTSQSCTVSYVSTPAQGPTISTKLVLADNATETTAELKLSADEVPYSIAVVDNIGVVTFKAKDAYTNALVNAFTGKMPTVTPATEDDPETADKDETAPASYGTTDGMTFKVYTAAKNATASVGPYKDMESVYTPVDYTAVFDLDNAPEGTNYTFEDNTLTIEGTATLAPSVENVYYIIKDDSCGAECITSKKKVNHYGNQIAYELLGLGYTILYKAIDTADDIGELKFWEALKDKSTYDFRYVLTGLTSSNDAANAAIISLCEWKNTTLDDADVIKDGRGDCFALVDLDSAIYADKTQSEAIPLLANEANKFSSAYAACFAPTVTYTMVEDKIYRNRTFPASFHYLACAANSAANNYSEWYANAGYTRGVAKYTIESTGCKLGDMAVQALQPRFNIVAGTYTDSDTKETKKVSTHVSVNLVIKIKNSYYLWGNRTAKKLGTRNAADGDLVAQHFLNIRQLCTTIKKQVYVTCRRLTYDPNSNNLWINFRSLLTPMLEKMKADQGIRDYAFVKDATDRKALLKARIRIVPIEAVEDFEIGLYLEDSLAEANVSEA